MIKPNLSRMKFILVVVLSFSMAALFGADRYSVASGYWNSTSTWSSTPGGAPGASIPGKNDDVFIEEGHTVTVTSNYECASVTFTGTIATLVVISPATLTLKSGIILNNQTDSDSECLLTGTGTLTCAEVIVGTTANPPPTDLSSSLYTHTFISEIAYLNISVKGAPKNDITINSYTGGTSHIRNGVFNLEEGTVSVDGQVSTYNQSASNTSTISMATGTASGVLNLRGRSSPFSLSGTGTNTTNLNGAYSLVNYSMTSAQTVLGTLYNNLTLSGSGIKTLTGASVNGILSMEGTATSGGTTPSYGTMSTLQYKGSAAQTTGIEFPSTFSGSGGIIIDNSSGITLNSNRNIEIKLTFVNGRINTGTYTLSLSSLADVLGAGPGKYVNGYLQKGIAAGTSAKTFEIGDASVYTPVVLEFTGAITTTGNITAKSTAGDHPAIGSSTFMAGVTVNRYWTLVNSGVSGYISYNATFNYVSGDVDLGADYNNFYIGNYNPTAWIYPTVGTKASTSTQATGLTTFGDFQIGELPIASYRSKTTGNWNTISTWESFDGTVWIDAAVTPTSSAGFISIRSSHSVTNTDLLTADQLIIDAGGSLILNSAITVNDGPGIDFTVSGTLDCNNNSIAGAGSFLLDNGAELIICSPEGISASGAAGDIQTLTRTFMPWANYNYRGTSGQVTGNGLPESVNNLTINNGAGVILSASVSINGILTLSDGEFSIGNNTLNFQNSDTPIARTSGTMTTTSDSNISFGSPLNTAGADFTIPSAAFTTDPVINNLTIYRNNNLTLNDQIMYIGGILLCNGPLDTNGNLTLLSTASGTALIDGSGTGEVSNNVTMQRYLPSAFGYKYVSSPFQAATVNEFADEVALTDPFPTFYRYNEANTTSGWSTYVTTTDPLNPLEGYAANFGSSAVTLTASATGVVNNGSLSVTLYNHNNTYTQGFNLVGNPYPSPIDWDALTGWTKTNIDNALYYFKSSTTDEYGGTYSTYINGVSSDGLATAVIPSMQGFFVHVSDGTYPVTGTLGLDNNVRIADLSHSFVKSAKKGTTSTLLRLGATFAGDETSTDPMVIYFDEKAGTGFDPGLDALKLMNTDYGIPNLYSAGTDGKKLSINALPESADTLCQIPLGLRINIDGYIVFKIINIYGGFSGKKINIYDAESGTRHSLTDNKEFRVFLNAGEYKERFYLNLSSIATGIIGTSPDNELFSVYSSHGIIKAYINTDVTGDGILSILNLTGQILFVDRIFETGYNEIYPGIKDGIYIVTFASDKYRFSKKIFIRNR